MRAFIAICLLATAAFAAPQGGYNYQQQQPQQPQQQQTFQIGLPKISGQTSAHASQNSIPHEGQSFFQEALRSTKLMQTLLSGQSSYAAPVPQLFYQQPQLQQQQEQQSFGFSQQQTYQPQQHYAQPQQQQQQYQQSASYAPAAPVITKDIYVHVAPEEPEEKYRPAPAPVAPPRKHYRIVFIKAPAPSISSQALHLKHTPTEEKTIIYVLTKKPDTLDLEAAFQDAAPKPPSKPEVYFIKYKTQEEAQHAQRTIQAQYDQLGGTTQVSDEGVAPVSSVIGALDHQQGGGQNAGLTTGAGFTSGGTTGSGVSTIGGSGYANESGVGSSGSGSSSSTSSSSSSSNPYLPPIVLI